MKVPLPITLIFGLPGAGKATLVEHHAAICGDSTELWLLLDRSDVRATSGDSRVEVMRWSGQTPVDLPRQTDCQRALIELPDACSPVAMAAKWASSSVAIDELVAVVFAPTFLQDFGTRQRLIERSWGDGRLAELPVVELLTEQLECATRVVLTGHERMGEEEFEAVCGIVSALNPSAAIVKFEEFESSSSRRRPAFSVSSWWRQTAWAKALVDGETSENTWVFRARRPFHPERFQAWLSSDWHGVLRSKGRFWLASRLEWVGLLSQSGAAVRTEPQGYWWAVVPPQDWPEEEEIRAEIFRHWDDQVGDCRQELAFVGVAVDHESLFCDLEGCLLTDSEMASGPLEWVKFADPFPVWSLD